MMVSLLWLFIGWVIVFSVGLLLIKRYTDYGNRFGGTPPLVLLRSKLGIELLDRLSDKSPRGWLAWGNIGLGVAYVGLLAGLLLVVQTVSSIILNPDVGGFDDPTNALVIPGVNDFLPLSMAPEIVLALLFALVVHEGGHGLMSRVGDIDVDATGLLLFAGLPIGAFVEPDQDSQEQASRPNRLRMFAAGIMNNVALTVIALLILFVPMTALIAPAAGGPVGAAVPNSAAETAGLSEGDRIVSVNGMSVETPEETRDAIANGGASVTVTLADGTTETIEKELLVVRAAERAPDGLSTGDVITQVNGEAVTTAQQYQAAIGQTTGDSVTLTTADGETVSVPAGVPVTAQADGPLATAGAPTGGEITVTAIDGERVYTADQLVATLESYDGSETVTVSTLVGGEQQTYEVTLSDGRLGVQASGGLGTIGVDDTGVRYYPAEQYLQLLSVTSGGDSSILQKLVAVLIFPAAGQAGSLFNFAGFTPAVQNFYVTAGPDFLGGLIFFGASLMFWTAWININLALFNCIPTYGLDGGHILRDTLNVIADRLPIVEAGDTVTSYLNHVVKFAMLAGLLFMLFGPAIL